jgi:hypothetical protein
MRSIVACSSLEKAAAALGSARWLPSRSSSSCATLSGEMAEVSPPAHMYTLRSMAYTCSAPYPVTSATCS